jgi:membrane protein DedA with SNARE-associated domain
MDCQLHNQFGYLGIGVAHCNEIISPIPSELIVLSRFMTLYQYEISDVVLFATIGSVVGAIILYGVGDFCPQKNGKDHRKMGTYFGLKKQDVKRAEGWLIRRGT